MSASTESAAASLEGDLSLLYSFVLAFGAYTRDQAFRMTVEASLKTVEGERRSPERVRIELFREILISIRRRPAAGKDDLSAFFELPAGRTFEYMAIRRALLAMDARQRTLVLLGDLCRFSTCQIGTVLDAEEKDVLLELDAARTRFQAGVRNTLGRDADQYRGIVDALHELGRSAPSSDLATAVRFEKKKIHAQMAGPRPFPWAPVITVSLAALAVIAYLWLRS